MKAMLLAAGRGERMRPLTDQLPKPLLTVRGQPLIVWHILNLVRAGISEIIINHAHLGHLITEILKDGSEWGARITYSAEQTALETAGGIALALPWLGKDPFVVIAADVYCPHFDFEKVKSVLVGNQVNGPDKLAIQDKAWVFLVKNPLHHLAGDFSLRNFRLLNEGQPRYTYSGIGVFQPQLFGDIQKGFKVKLAPLLRQWADANWVGAELYEGEWTDVGTPERLAALNKI